MQAGRNSGERTGNNAPVLGTEVTQPKNHGSFNTRTNNSGGTRGPAEGAEPSGSAPLVFPGQSTHEPRYWASSSIINSHRAVSGGASRVGAFRSRMRASTRGSRGAWICTCM